MIYLKVKKKIKRKLKNITMYLNEDEYEELFEVTKFQNISFTDWLKDAMYLKLDQDSLNINQEPQN